MTNENNILRMGRMGYLNVLPIHLGLECGAVPGEFEVVSGPPAWLNKLMSEGLLHLSSCSSIEYARHYEQYDLMPELCIGSRGPVMSVLLLSRVPLDHLNGKIILVSAQTHTSAVLLRLLMREHLKLDVRYSTGDPMDALEAGARPDAILCIGDQALSLRTHPDYPHRLDLGQAWRRFTGLPFIFGVWVSRKAEGETAAQIRRARETLLASYTWGRTHMTEVVDTAAKSGLLSRPDMERYFKGLVFDLGQEELEGLKLFFERLVEAGEIGEVPPLP